MGIDLFWDGKEQQVFLLEFKGDWTWDDLDAVLQVTRRISRERQQIIGAILDLRDAVALPGGFLFKREGLNQFRELLKMSRSGRENGPLVVVGIGGFFRSLIDTVGRINQRAVSNVHFAETMSEARQLMRAQMAQRAANAV